MPPRSVPDDDLYARLELTPDASPEAVEVAWRALLKRHHPDVAGDDEAALERAKRINVAHDWLRDPALRDLYDRERLVPPVDGSTRGRGPRATRAGWTVRRPTPRPRRTDLHRGEPEARAAWFLDRVARLTLDDVDRLAATTPPPIAFHATIRRFVPAAASSAYERLARQVEERAPVAAWTDPAARDALLAVAAELALGASLDELLDGPFRARARERLLRAWEAAADQPRHGPNRDEVAAFIGQVRAVTAPGLAALVRASRGIDAGRPPWPDGMDPDEEEGLRISAVLAARDAGAALEPALVGMSVSQASRVRRLVTRLAHVVALRHAFAPRAYEALLVPWRTAMGDPGRPERQAGATTGSPGVRRAR